MRIKKSKEERRRESIANRASDYCSFLVIHRLLTDGEKFKIHKRIIKKLGVIRVAQ